MKNKIILLLAICFMLLSCSKTEPNSPETPGKNDPEEITYTTSASIGVGGGKLTDVTLQIDIPSGAFAKSYNVVVKRATTGASFSEYESSTFYKIEGVPINFSKPVKVAITPAAGSPDNLLMTVMEEKYSPSLGKMVLTSNFITAVKSGNTYICDFTPYTGAVKDTTISLTFGLVKNYQELPATKAGSSFKIYSPQEFKPDAFDLRDYLDQIYAIVQNDLQFSYAKRTSWPMSVTIKKMSNDVWGYFVQSSWSHNYSSLEFNALKLTSKTELKATAGHEFFHFAKSLYSDRSTLSMLTRADPFYWLDEASSVWFESIASGQPGYNPLVRQGHHLEPLKGAFKGAEENAEQYGYGMAAFVKYLVQTNDNLSLVKMYNLISNGSVNNPVSAVNQAHKKLFQDIYPDFLQSYFEGKIYTDFQPSSLLSNANETFNIATETDTIKTYKRDYEAISAQIYRVNFSYDELTELDELSIFSNSFGPFMVYKVDGTGVNLMGRAFDQFTVSDLKGLKDKNASILVIQPNISLTKETQTVEFKVEKTVTINAVWAKLYVRGDFSGGISSSISVEVPLQVKSDDWPNYPMLKGTFSNITRVFSSSYNGNSVVCTFDFKAKTITGSVSFQNRDVSFSNRAVKANVSFTSLPLYVLDGKQVSQYKSAIPKGTVTLTSCEYYINDVELHTILKPTQIDLYIYFGKKKE